MNYRIITEKNGKRIERKIQKGQLLNFLSSAGVEKLHRFGWFACSVFVIECR